MARIKQVFTSKDEIAHLWAYQTQDHARIGNYSFYFNGKSIYSYGSHFEIARILELKDEDIVLWNDHTYSNTTSTHQNAVSYAIRSNQRVIRVDKMPYSGNPKNEGFKDTMVHNIRKHIETAQMYCEKQVRARKTDYTHEIQDSILQARGIATLFRIKSRLKKSEREIVFAEDIIEAMLSEEQREGIKERQTRAKEARRLRHQKDLALAQEQVDKWRAFESNHCPYVVGYLLRHNKRTNEIETSRHASVPMGESLLLWRLVQKTMESGVAWKRNGKTFEIGAYSVDRINVDGDIVVGCHRITFEEMNKLATELNWN